jgi:hypothetical protein
MYPPSAVNKLKIIEASYIKFIFLVLIYFKKVGR